MLKIYDLNASRSIRINWLLEELNIEYEVVAFKRDEKTHRGPAELYKIHPLGKVPIIEDDGKIIVESGAIIEYILNKFDKEGSLAPLVKDEEWERYIQFLHYVEGSAFPQIMPFVAEKVCGEQLPAGIRGFFQNELLLQLKYISNEIQSSGYLLKRGFSVVDINIAFFLDAVKSSIGLDNYPEISTYLDKIEKRSAYKKALAKQEQT